MNPLVTGLVAFIGAAFVVSLVPGPSTVMIIRQSVRSGRRAGMATMLGNEVGVLVWGLAATFGLSALLVASRLAYDGSGPHKPKIPDGMILVGIRER